MSRSLPECSHPNHDAKVPDRVRLRIFEREGGICHLSGRKIMPGEKWELEHKIALCNRGLHAESNLAPALVQPHKVKTAADVAEKAKVARKRKKFIGIRKNRTITKWRKFNGEIVSAPRERK